ncbi:uncharacterized protein LOC130646295 [Hydractinia symbiolongicarpus]|uniref:uncharacterized protein LOC130646295 n=1 Tax=Hydractinia symbiolongicarpus TaxID=13093 RepID=UPI00254C78DD|nr:uncharacterized protein LOC130646295 [Hydractinia symbiolongicarpus]
MSWTMNTTSTGSELKPIYEDKSFAESYENDVFKSPRNSFIHAPPQIPNKDSDMDERCQYINDAITWVKEELTSLKQQDKNLMHAYKDLMVTMTTLKKMNTTFQEQGVVIESMNTKEESPAIVDLPRQDSSEQRYKRIGLGAARLYSYS